MSIYQSLEVYSGKLVGVLWGIPLVTLLVGGGVFFLLYSRFLPYKYLHHGVRLLLKTTTDDSRGQLSHFQALSTALSGTLGMGNVAGVAIAIALGGPGAVFWMWLSALLGVATKFYTCSLAVMFRGQDSEGNWQGGPMYVIREGLGPRFKPLAYFFALAGLLGTTPLFQVNQLVQILRDTLAPTFALSSSTEYFIFNVCVGFALAALLVFVAIGRLPRLAKITSLMVPAMVLGYLLLTIGVLSISYREIPHAFVLIFSDAFTGNAVTGGVVGSVIIMGIQRAAFSNEAGIGTEAMAHGAARTKEPVREGLVAMLGPVIDTLIVCTCTALVILVSGVWQSDNNDGVSLTASAFDVLFPGGGPIILAVVVTFLSLSTVFTFWYYGSKCLGFLIGAKYQRYYVWFYALLVVFGAVVSLQLVINIVDSMYALMAIPTMTSAFILAPKVNRSAKAYFSKTNNVQ